MTTHWTPWCSMLGFFSCWSSLQSTLSFEPWNRSVADGRVEWIGIKLNSIKLNYDSNSGADLVRLWRWADGLCTFDLSNAHNIGPFPRNPHWLCPCWRAEHRGSTCWGVSLGTFGRLLADFWPKDIILATSHTQPGTYRHYMSFYFRCRTVNYSVV